MGIELGYDLAAQPSVSNPDVLSCEPSSNTRISYEQPTRSIVFVIISIVPSTFSSSFKQGTKKVTSMASADPCSADQGLISGSIASPQVIHRANATQPVNKDAGNGFASAEFAID